MKRVMVSLLLAAGCSSNGIGITMGDGGDWRGQDLSAGDLAGPACATLDENGCKSDPRCVADYCAVCSCTASFAACRAPGDPQTRCPTPPCAFMNCNCPSLGAADCTMQMGCQPYACPDCSGVSQFLSCLPMQMTPPACPAPLCPLMGCRNDSECSMIGYCLPPGVAACGDAFPPACTTDADCASLGGVCAANACTGSKICSPPCTPSSCAVGQACVNQRCVPQACAGQGTCPSHFVCNGGACDRQQCLKDSDCGTGACVDTRCYDGPGMCQRPAG
jgi:hypothetical protein